MRHKHYPFSSDEEGCFFEFESIGPKGIIEKVVSFDYMFGETWNLAFGDRTENDLTDSVVSNNEDLVKVMATVIAATIKFSERYPNRTIRAYPLDKRRKVLYNTILRRNFKEIDMVFEVFGKTELLVSKYSPDQNFEEFYFSRIKPNFVQN